MGKKSKKKKHGRIMHERVPANERRQEKLAFRILFFGIILFFWGCWLAEETFIPNRVLWLTAFAGAFIGIAIFAWLWRRFRQEWGLSWYIGLVLFFGILAGVPVPFFAVNALNYYFKSEEKKQVIPMLLKKDYATKKRKCRYPYLIVSLNDIPNRINFPCGTEIPDEYKVALTVSEGFLGYYVIIDKRLTE